MTTPIKRTPRKKNTARQRQLGKWRAADNGSETLTDPFAESTMKLQTNVKAGSGCGGCGSLIDVDLVVIIGIGLFGGHKKRC
jgi:hypothetical protein